jgi:hypothetical protein
MSPLAAMVLILGTPFAYILILTPWNFYRMRAFPYQIKQDGVSKVAELQRAFDAAAEIIRSTPNAPRQKAAQEILETIAAGNLAQARTHLAEPKPTNEAVKQARTGMRNVEAAISELAHDKIGKFIGIPGANDAVQRLLRDSMHPDPFRSD